MIIKDNKYIMPILIFFICLIIYNLNFTYSGTGDTVPNVFLPLSIIKYHSLSFNDVLAKEVHLDAAKISDLYFFTVINSRYISSFPILPGLLNLPSVFIASLFTKDLLPFLIFLSEITSSIIASLSVVFIYLALKNILKIQKVAVFLALIFAFATSIYSVASQGLWQHGPAALLLAIALYLIFLKKEKYLPWAGFFLGLTVVNRPVNLFIALPLMIYLFFNERKIFKYALIYFIIPLLFLGWYSLVYWHNIFALGNGLAGGVFQDAGFGGNFFTGFSGNLFGFQRGLLFFSPILVFSFIFLIYFMFKKCETIYKYLGVIVIAMIIVYSLWTQWYGGVAFYGYRFLIDILPILILFLGLAWVNIPKNKLFKSIFVLLLIYSVYTQFIGVFYKNKIFIPKEDVEEEQKNVINPQRRWEIKRSQFIRGSQYFFDDLKKLINL